MNDERRPPQRLGTLLSSDAHRAGGGRHPPFEDGTQRAPRIEVLTCARAGMPPDNHYNGSTVDLARTVRP